MEERFVRRGALAVNKTRLFLAFHDSSDSFDCTSVYHLSPESIQYDFQYGYRYDFQHDYAISTISYFLSDSRSSHAVSVDIVGKVELVSKTFDLNWRYLDLLCLYQEGPAIYLSGFLAHLRFDQRSLKLSLSPFRLMQVHETFDGGDTNEEIIGKMQWMKILIKE